MIFKYGGTTITTATQTDEVLQEIKRTARDLFQTAGRAKNPSKKTMDTMDFLSEVIAACEKELDSRKKRAA